MRLNARKIRVRERSRDAKGVRFREVDLPRVSKWYMTDEERLRESRRIDGVEVVPSSISGVTQPDRRGVHGSKVRRVALVAVRWLKG